jgi:hypothetical protein
MCYRDTRLLVATKAGVYWAKCSYRRGRISCLLPDVNSGACGHGMHVSGPPNLSCTSQHYLHGKHHRPRQFIASLRRTVLTLQFTHVRVIERLSSHVQLDVLARRLTDPTLAGVGRVVTRGAQRTMLTSRTALSCSAHNTDQLASRAEAVQGASTIPLAR